jgi:predicted PurR-regulated permease PerM
MIDSSRQLRSRIFYTLFSLFGLVITVYLFAVLYPLILPTLIGILLAYITKPLITLLMKWSLPKSVAVTVILLLYGLIIFGIGTKIYSLVPSNNQQLVLRVQMQEKINNIYLDVLGKKDFASPGNFVDELFGKQIEPLLVSFNDFFSIDKKEEKEFYAYLNSNAFSEKERAKIEAQYQNLKNISLPKSTEKVVNSTVSESPLPKLPSLIPASKITQFFSELSKWIVMPFVFLFVLLDDGEIRKFFIGIMPNRYFEMSLMVFNSVDNAIGKYLRGTILQSSLVGLTIIIGLLLIGFKPSAAFTIGIVAGISNAIPFLGPIIGLGAGILYAMIVEEINPILPFLSSDAGIAGVIVVVLIAQFLDNTVFQPYVLGKAVNLHPLVVVLGVTGGSIAFGFWGMFLAIPTIVVFRVIISTLYQQLKAYQIIY